MKALKVAALTMTLVASSTVVALARNSPWLTVDQARQYAMENLGADSPDYPYGIQCRLSDGWVQVRFMTRNGQKPFDRWQFAVSQDPAGDLLRINAAYRIISTDEAGSQRCALGYR